MYNGSTLPSIVGSLYWFRRIYLEEGIQLVHGHSVSIFFILINVVLLDSGTISITNNIDIVVSLLFLCSFKASPSWQHTVIIVCIVDIFNNGTWSNDTCMVSRSTHNFYRSFFIWLCWCISHTYEQTRSTVFIGKCRSCYLCFIYKVIEWKITFKGNDFRRDYEFLWLFSVRRTQCWEAVCQQAKLLWSRMLSIQSFLYPILNYSIKMKQP